MKEDFLHYVWKFQKFNKKELSVVTGEALKIISPGEHNFNSGPDFFNSKLTIKNQLWAGNVEIHINSSHWFEHHHERDTAYDNVILHVVWNHDANIFRSDNSIVPTLELNGIIRSSTLNSYHNLFSEKNKWINCENEFAKVDAFVLDNWLERMYFERLEYKSEFILKELKTLKNHWEALLFRMLCKNFGLKVNGDSFLSLAQSVDFAVVQKCSRHKLELEALLLGQSGILNGSKEDGYFQQLQAHYMFLKHKFRLYSDGVISPKYFRLRPPNFPTIRLSQLSVLYATRKALFSEIIKRKEPQEFYELFDISVSEYWHTHYSFGLPSAKRKKFLSKKFIDLLIINTVIPLKFCYAKFSDVEITDELLMLASKLASEQNNILKQFGNIGYIADNAQKSQALLHLKPNFCDKNRCLNCGVGAALLKG